MISWTGCRFGLYGGSKENDEKPEAWNFLNMKQECCNSIVASRALYTLITHLPIMHVISVMSFP
jgi:hypothetical protein